MIEVEQLTKRFGGFTAIDGLSFHVAPGEIVGLLGRNGAGKTTTMRVLAGYMPATRGRVRVAGYDAFRDSLKVRRRIGYMPESVPLYPEMRVREYLRYRAALKGVPGRRLKARLRQVEEQCGLAEAYDRVIGKLSKGYRQRVGLADALLHEPGLLILDEPTIGLDPVQIREVRSLIRGLAGRHTVLLSTHILSEVQMTCERVIVLHEGRIRAADSTSNLVQNFRAAGRVRVSVRACGDDAVVALGGVDGVREVERLEPEGEWEQLRLRVEANRDIREAIYLLARGRGWVLRELSQEEVSLEDVFLEVTQAA